MRNTYNVSLLRRRILDAMPRALTEVGQAAVEAFLSLPGASAWRPDRFGLKELSFVFDLGLPLALIGDNPSAKSIALAMGDAARDGRQPDKPVASAVHAAALLSRWGATVQFAAAGPAGAAERAWRIEASWPTGPAFDVVLRGTASGAPGVIDAADNVQPVGERPVVLVAVVDAALEDTAATLDATFAHAPHVAAALVIQPRFWIGIEQKEWLHRARLNPAAQVTLAADQLGGADGDRRALRLALLV